MCGHCLAMTAGEAHAYETVYMSGAEIKSAPQHFVGGDSPRRDLQTRQQMELEADPDLFADQPVFRAALTKLAYTDFSGQGIYAFETALVDLRTNFGMAKAQEEMDLARAKALRFVKNSDGTWEDDLAAHDARQLERV